MGFQNEIGLCHVGYISTGLQAHCGFSPRKEKESIQVAERRLTFPIFPPISNVPGRIQTSLRDFQTFGGTQPHGLKPMAAFMWSLRDWNRPGFGHGGTW